MRWPTQYLNCLSILSERLLRFFNIDIVIPVGNIPMSDSPTSIQNLY